MSVERGKNWIKFRVKDSGYFNGDEVQLIRNLRGGSIEIMGECSGHAGTNLTSFQLIALRDFLQEIL